MSVVCQDLESQVSILETLFQNAPVGFSFVDSEFRYVRVNEALAAIKGISVADHIGKTVSEIVPLLWHSLEPLYRRALAGETILNHDITGIADAADGRVRHWLASYYPIRHQNKVIGTGVIVNDITDRKHAEQQLSVRNNLYAMLSRTNRAVNLCRSKDELFREVCTIAVEAGRFRFAWIGIPENNRVNMVASAGDDGGYMQDLVITLDENDPRSHGPTGRAVVTGNSFVVNDFIASPATALWHASAQRVGFAASATFPLKESGRVVAVLNLYALTPGFFTADLQSTLSEVAPTLSGALEGYTQETERKKVLEDRKRLWNLTLDPMCVAGFNGYFRQINPAWNRALGWSQDELLRQRWIDFVHPDDREATEQATKVLIEGQTLKGFENRYRHKDGTYRWFSWNAFPFVETRTIFGIVRDVTDQKSSERALRESEKRYRVFVEHSLDALFLQNSYGIIIDVNEQACANLGYSRDELIGMKTAEFCPDLSASLQAEIDADFANGQYWVFESRYQRKDGTHFPVEVRIRPFEVQSELIDLLLVRDLTQWKKAESLVQQSEHRLGTLLQHLDVGVVLHDADDRILFINATASKLLGVTKDPLIGVTSRDPRWKLITEDGSDYPPDLVPSVVAARTRKPVHNAIIGTESLDNGSQVWLQVSARPRVNPDGSLLDVLVTIVDITDRKRIEAERNDISSRLRLQIERMPIAYVLFDADLRYSGWNPAAEQIFGYSRDEILGQPISFLLPETERPRVEAIASRLRAGDVTAHNINHNVTKDGRLITCEWHNTPLTEPDGTFVGVLSMTIDVTERVRAELALRESEERLRLALAAGRMGTFDWDLSTDSIIWSDTHYDLFGYPVEDRFPVQFHHFADRIHPDDRAAVEREIHKAMVARTTYTNECRILLPDGTIRWVMGSGAFLCDVDGQPTRMLGTVIDITDRKRDEIELRFRDRAMSTVSQGIVITNADQPDNPIVYASPSFERLTGYSTEEIVGRNCRFLQGKDTDLAVVAQLSADISKKQTCSVEIVNYRKDGTPFWNSLTISPVLDGNDRVTHFVGVQTDVTERRRLEDQFRQAQKMEAIGQLAGGVAHDFNNLLTVIYGYSEVSLSQIDADDPLHESFLEINKAAERAGTLTQQLLMFSRQQVLAIKVLNLNDVVIDTEKMLRRLIGADVILVTTLSPALAKVKADPGQVAQILINFAVNARDAMPRGGRLVIATQNVMLDANFCRGFEDLPPGDYVLLKVTDNGCGIDEATLPRIFEPFFTTKDIGRGTGLGLATVHGIVKQSRGHITVETAVEQGTTFNVYLPAVSEPKSEDRNRTTRSEITRGVETVLLVEDEEAVRNMTKQFLQKQGYRVLEAANGRDAIQVSETFAGLIDLLVSDVVMPHLGGLALAEQILQKRPECKVLFLSGYTNDETLRHGISSAQFEFLSKPFTQSAFNQKVRSVLDRLSR